ncbi:hypothetical protein GCM10027445_03750 [Amycolatopsis endophytica]
MPGDRHHREQHHARAPGSAERAPPRGPQRQCGGDGDSRGERHQQRGGPAQARQQIRAGRHHERPGGQQHDLPGEPLQRDGPHPAREVPLAAPLAHRAPDVAEDPGGEDGVQQNGAVVGRYRRGEPQRQAEGAADDTPPGGGRDGGEEPEPQREDDRDGIDEPQPVEEHTGTGLPHERDENRRSRDQPHPGPHPALPRSPVGGAWGAHQVAPIASRSVWCTIARSSPASQASRRRRT